MSVSSPVLMSPRDLLAPFLACLPAGFASSKPPPDFLPLLSPILRQKVQFLATDPSESWLLLLCRDTQDGPRFKDLIEDCSTFFEPHPVSGEIECDSTGPNYYHRFDEETLKAVTAVEELDINIIFVWCPQDIQGFGNVGGWRISEVTLPEGDDKHKEWSSTISDAEDSFRQRQSSQSSESRSSTVPFRHLPTETTMGSSDNDDDYWRQYDATPSRTPGPGSSSNFQQEASARENDRTNTTGSEDSYFKRYASVQPEMDPDDSSAESLDRNSSTLLGKALVRSEPKPDGRSVAAISSASVERLDAAAEVNSLTETAIRTHVAVTIKSLWRLSRTVGISRSELMDTVQQELNLLEVLEEDEEYKMT